VDTTTRLGIREVWKQRPRKRDTRTAQMTQFIHANLRTKDEGRGGGKDVLAVDLDSP